MSLERLQNRTGPVDKIALVILNGYAHSFSHRGQDGSAKGNIEAREGGHVRGVLYRLQPVQVEALAPYEGGYDVIDVTVQEVGGSQFWPAYSYMAPKDAAGLLPLASYLEHYLQGMHENRFPASYLQMISQQASR